MKRLISLMIGLIMSMVMASSAYAAPINIDEDSIVVEVDGFKLEQGDTETIRQLERGEEFTLKVRMEATGKVEDVEINAFVSGFEHSSSAKISDFTRPFDLDENESVVKRLDLKLPERADEDRYKIRVIISDRDNDPIVLNYNIKIEPSDAQVVIKNFELSPENEIQAGRAILATVRVKNYGDSDENDVRIKVSIPDLGVSATPDFIDDLESDESATSEEFFLKIDRCTRPGLYEVLAVVDFDDGDKTVSESITITVTEGICDDVADKSATDTPKAGRTTIAYSTEPQSLVEGGTAVSYPITITNSGSTTKIFMLSVDNTDWADFSLSPSNLITVNGGSTQTAFVSASALEGTQAGDKVFTVTVKDSSGNVLQSLVMRATVLEGRASAGVPGLDVRTALTTGLVVIVALLVVVGLVLAFRRVKGGEEGESQTYY